MSVLPNEQPLQDGGASGGNQNPSQPIGNPLEEKLNQVSADVQRALGMIGSMQSDKDKAAFRAEALSKDNAGQIAKIAQYLNLPVEQVQEAQRRSVLDDLVRERIDNSQPVVPAPSQVQQPTGTQVQLSDIDAALELPANDPRLTALKIVHAGNPEAYAVAAGKLKASFNPSPPSPVEQLPNVRPVQQQQQPTGNALQQEYDRRIREIAQTPNLSVEQRIERNTNLKAEYRQKGLVNLR